MAEEANNVEFEAPEVQIYLIRGQHVILDTDLALLYGVTSKRLNEQRRRNADRFPEDFAFQLTDAEFASLRSQFATLKKSRGAHRKYPPWVFTEHGALQAANVLSSGKAVQMSLYIIRAFVKMREQLAANAEILKRLAEIDKTLLKHDAALREVFQKLLPLLQAPPPGAKRRIGFSKDKE